MRLKLKYKNWKKNNKISFKPKLIRTLVICTTVLIFILLTWLLGAIYTQDKPAFVPKETRGAIRESIKENIAAPMAAVIPGVGNPFFNAAFTYKNNDSFTNSNNFGSDGPENKNWKTYKDEELGFEIKYPDGYTSTINNNVKNFYEDANSDIGFSIYVYKNYNGTTEEWWKNSGVNNPEEFDFLGSQNFRGDRVEHYRGVGGLMENHYLLKLNDTVLDIVFLGVKDEIIQDIIFSIK